MLLTEYDETRRRALDRKEGYDEGYDDGRTEGRGEMVISALRRLVRNLGMTPEQAAAAMGIAPEERGRYIRLAGGKEERTSGSVKR